uniref:RRM domain-containing protein n=1 Tax=Alexandrium monilatum TaxID=311494 RepID=A0A7S4RK27_9DINO
MDVLPLRVVATLAPPEAAACDNFFSLSAKSATEPLKIRLRGRSLAESSGDESETTATGARTPDTHTSSAAAEPSSPAFVTQGSLETVTAVAAAPHARKLLDASAPAFVPEGPGWARSSAPGCGAGPAEGAAPRQPSKMLLVRNVPEWYTPEMLLEEIRDSGFRMHQDFDFFYMPQDCRLGLNPGYSMLSFRDEGAAKAFEAAFHKKTPRLTEHAPAFEVRPAPGKDWVKICSEVAASQAKRKEGSMGLAPSFPRQARYCPQCGSEADFARFNFCSQCGASLPQLRPRSLLG